MKRLQALQYHEKNVLWEDAGDDLDATDKTKKLSAKQKNQNTNLENNAIIINGKNIVCNPEN